MAKGKARQPGFFGRRVRLSTLCLTTVALFDLVTTMVLLGRGMEEGNPLFAWLLGYGPQVFVGAKVVFLAGPILILEFVRMRSPRSAEQGTWLAFLAYAGLYGAHLMQIRG